jgi:hypothetical protein
VLPLDSPVTAISRGSISGWPAPSSLSIIEPLQELVGSELNFLVPPLRSAKLTGD